MAANEDGCTAQRLISAPGMLHFLANLAHCMYFMDELHTYVWDSNLSHSGEAVIW